jgi:ABC-type multidrug transport system fused ATPase/permease subunit
VTAAVVGRGRGRGLGRWDMEERMVRIREACRVANCLDFIEKWEHGFDTVSRHRL